MVFLEGSKKVSFLTSQRAFLRVLNVLKRHFLTIKTHVLTFWPLVLKVRFLTVSLTESRELGPKRECKY